MQISMVVQIRNESGELWDMGEWRFRALSQHWDGDGAAIPSCHEAIELQKAKHVDATARLLVTPVVVLPDDFAAEDVVIDEGMLV